MVRSSWQPWREKPARWASSSGTRPPGQGRGQDRRHRRRPVPPRVRHAVGGEQDQRLTVPERWRRRQFGFHLVGGQGRGGRWPRRRRRGARTAPARTDHRRRPGRRCCRPTRARRRLAAGSSTASTRVVAPPPPRPRWPPSKAAATAPWARRAVAGRRGSDSLDGGRGRPRRRCRSEPGTPPSPSATATASRSLGGGPGEAVLTGLARQAVPDAGDRRRPQRAPVAVAAVGSDRRRSAAQRPMRAGRRVSAAAVEGRPRTGAVAVHGVSPAVNRDGVMLGTSGGTSWASPVYTLADELTIDWINPAISSGTTLLGSAPSRPR